MLPGMTTTRKESKMDNLICKHGNLNPIHGGHCDECEAERNAKRLARNAARRAAARETRQAYADLGLVRVRGALGGIYYE